MLDRWDEVAALAPDFEELAKNAIESSPCTEAWMLVPALRHLREDATIKVVLIYAPDTSKTARHEILCAVFPFEIKRGYRHLPVTIYRLWNHLYSLFPAPLLRRNYAAECVHRIFAWIADDGPALTLLEFPDVRSNSAFSAVLNNELRTTRRIHTAWTMTRALYTARADPHGSVAAIGTSSHRTARRQQKRLAELGNVELDAWQAGTSHQRWIDEFVDLEMSGWKGRAGTALGCNPSHRAYLNDIAAGAATRGRLMVLALRLDGRPLAMRLNILDEPGSYAFKAAFDEAYAKYSPGMLLELENIRRLRLLPSIRWMDSLAVPNHELINRVWHDRVTVTTTLIAPTRFPAGLIVEALPFMGAVRRLVRRALSRSRAG